MNKEPQILGTKTVASSRLFQVEEVELRFANGHEASYERLIGHTGGVLVVPVTDNDKLLLIQEYAVGLERYELGFVKGRIEPGESPKSAASREMREEIGLDAEEYRYLATVSMTPAYSDHRTSIFLALGLFESPLKGDEPEEIGTVPWLLSDLNELRQREEFSDARCWVATYLVSQELTTIDG